MKRYLLLLMSIFLIACAAEKSEIKDFGACVAKGYPIMESYPMKCRTPDGDIFVQKIDMSLEEATEIAKNSECLEKGTLTDKSVHNENTQTWWIDLDMKPEFKRDYCNPACVVNEVTRQAEINWRCTGLLPP